jgi:hypothetical protein
LRLFRSGKGFAEVDCDVGIGEIGHRLV